MPIYAYKCASCGHARDVLQKISDEPLSVCPQCGATSFNKQVTAAGFQLKGSGWYVTDFKNNAASSASNNASSSNEPASQTKTEAKTETKTTAAASDAGTSTPSPAPTPSPSTGN